MGRSTRAIPAGEFKARCLSLLDEVAETGQPFVVTKRGRPVAQISPLKEAPSLRGSVVREGDLISPVEGTWDAAS